MPNLTAPAAAFTAFAVFGLFTSLAPGLVAGPLQHPGRLFAGVVTFLVFGAGMLFKSAVGAVAAAAPAGERGEALAGLFPIAYLGLVVPVLGLGVATLWMPATTATLWFTAVLLAALGGIAARPR